MRLPAMPWKNSEGLSSTSTRLRRASKRVLWLCVNLGQSCAPGMIGLNAASIWQPLHTPRAKVSSRPKKAANWSASFGLNMIERAQPSPAPRVSP